MVRQNGADLALKAWNFAGRAPRIGARLALDVAFHPGRGRLLGARGYPGWAPCCAMSARQARTVKPRLVANGSSLNTGQR